MGNEAKAVSCFEENLRRKDEEQILDKELGECLLYLSKYYKMKGNTEKSLIYARRLFDFNGPERDEANSILYEINKNVANTMNQGGSPNF
jgi:anaphase-promoting complex subunit 8